MNKKDYLNSPVVKSFIEWIRTKLDVPNSFCHEYEMKKPKSSWIVIQFTLHLKIIGGHLRLGILQQEKK